LRFLLQKAHPCVNARRLSHFASKSVGGSDLQRWAGKKSQKVARGSHRNDVSPLTQGLRYRAACDKQTKIISHPLSAITSVLTSNSTTDETWGEVGSLRADIENAPEMFESTTEFWLTIPYSCESIVVLPLCLLIWVQLYNQLSSKASVYCNCSYHCL